MTNKLLTIIVPTYNMETCLDKNLNSLVLSDKDLMRSLEVLVVNDGSTDNSSAIAHRYEDMYPETFHVIDKENGNYGSCINRGLKEANGRYIRIMDADDWYDTVNFELFLRKIEKVNVDKIATIYTEVRAAKKTSITQPYQSEVVMDMIDVKSGNYIPMHAITYRTQLLRDINYKQTEGISYTDYEWMFLPMPYVKTLYYVPLDIYQYFVGREGQTVDPAVIKKSYPLFFRIIRGVLDSFLESIKIAPNPEYVMENITHSVGWIYFVAFIQARFQGNTECVLAMDDYLEEYYPTIHKRLEDISDSRLFHYQFVCEWRKKGRPLKMSQWHKQIYELTHLHVGVINLIRRIRCSVNEKP